MTGRLTAILREVRRGLAELPEFDQDDAELQQRIRLRGLQREHDTAVKFFRRAIQATAVACGEGDGVELGDLAVRNRTNGNAQKRELGLQLSIWRSETGPTEAPRTANWGWN